MVSSSSDSESLFSFCILFSVLSSSTSLASTTIHLLSSCRSKVPICEVLSCTSCLLSEQLSSWYGPTLLVLSFSTTLYSSYAQTSAQLINFCPIKCLVGKISLLIEFPI